MKKVIDTGENELAQNINDAKTEHLITEGKLQEVDTQVDKNSENLQNQDKKITEIKAQIENQNKIIKGLGINIKAIDNHQKNTIKTEESLKKANLKKEGLKKEISLIKARSNVTHGDYNNRRQVLLKQIEKATEAIDKKDE